MDETRYKNVKAVSIALVALGASASLAVFAVPLYRLFCQVTGYGGTTQTADAGKRTVFDRTITIRFDSSIAPDLPWTFEPVQRTQEVKVGETALAFYRAENRSERPITGSATFNVTPHKVGRYFSKIECFCFTEQTLGPGETADMPVTYFIDPAIMADRGAEEVTEITLSYTFFLREFADERVASAAAAQTQSTAASEAKPLPHVTERE